MRPYPTRLLGDGCTRHRPAHRNSPHTLGRPLQPAAMREMNIGALMRAIRVLGPRARVELAEYTGISPATVTKLVASLTEAALLTELAEQHRVRLTGRPRVPVDFSPGSRAVLALHLGPERLTAAALDLRGSVLAARSVDTPQTSAVNAVRAGLRVLTRVQRSLPDATRVLGAGITSDGRIDRENGLLRGWPGHDGETSWQDTDVLGLAAQALELPVEFDRQVRGEALAGLVAESGLRHLLHLAVRDRVECALVVDQRLVHGATGEAGGIEHWPVPGARGPECSCGQPNCLATVAGDRAAVLTARERGALPAAGGYDDLVEAAEQRDRGALGVLRNRARWIGRSVATMSDLLDPDQVLISGTGSSWSGFEAEVRQAVDAAPGPADSARLRFESEPEQPVVAAGALFLDRYFADPVGFEPELRRRLID